MSAKLNYNGVDYQNEIVAGARGLDMTHAMVGETLAVDTLTVPVVTGDMPVRLIAADQDENSFVISSDGEIFCLIDGAPPEFIKNGVGKFYFGEDLIGAYYFEELRQSGPYEHVMRFLSGIRLLDRSDHPGGLYSGEPAGDVIADIIGDIVPYTIDEDIAEILIYNYLPYARRRNNLQFVLMAIGAAIRNNADGSLRITQLSDTVTGVFDAERVFLGGSVIDKVPATAVQVTEHNYLPSDEEVELFNDSTISTETVKFKEPIHDLQITGGTIISSGVNFCTFSGSGAVVLTGKRYTHVTRIITVGTPPTGIDSDVVKSVSNNTLLGPNNAVFVAEKLYDYLSVAKSIKQEVVFGTERPADVVKVLHPHTKELVDACIKSMHIQFGKTELRAMCEFLVGYKPPGATTGFTHYVVLTGSGTWTVPEGVIKIRAIIVGGGGGGFAGEKGKNSVPSSSIPYGGAGGAGGEGGNGGLIFEINLAVTPEAEYNYFCGSGGAAGTEGTATTFGTLSSVLGRLYPYGYSEPKTGLTFGTKGAKGIDGGHGNNYDEPIQTLEYDGITYYPGENGADYNFGSTRGYGGGGGGPAVGSSGGDGGDAGWLYGQKKNGDGGRGADAADGDDSTIYGGGGMGGHGGGGGGYAVDFSSIDSSYLPTVPGYGGNGGNGGKGGDGCIVIYY